MNIRNIVFDFGGVIASIDFDKAVQAFKQIGLKDADRRLDKYHQTEIFQELEEGKLTTMQFQQLLGNLCGRTLNFEETQKAWLGFITEVNLHQLRYIEELHAHYRLYLLSNTNPYIMSWACSEAFSPEGKPLTHYLDRLYCSYQMGYTKPDERIFQRLLEDASILPEETLFVDDGLNNIQAAQKLGMHTLHTVNGKDWCDALSEKIRLPDRT